MSIQLQFDFGVPQTGVGYQFYNDEGILLGSRITDNIFHGPAAGQYQTEANPPDGFVGVYWDCDNPIFNGFEQLVQTETVIPFPPITIDFTGASPQFVTEPVGPFIYCEPDVGGATDPIVVAVQGGIFSGLNFSGTACTIQKFGSNDYDYLHPVTVRNLIVDKIGNSTFRIQADSLANNLQTVGVRFAGNLNRIGTAELEVDNFGRLALALDDLLCAFRHIPRYEEPGRIGEDGTKAIWGWGSWHISPDPVIVRNGRTWVNRTSFSNNYAIDYKRGMIFFANYLNSGEEIWCTYEFRMLDLLVYRRFFQIALDLINVQKPQTAYGQDSYPSYYDGALLLGAYVQACKVLIPKMSMFRYRRLFENPDQLISSLQNNMSTAQEQWEAVLPRIKRRGLIAPASVSTYISGREFPILWDGTNVVDQLIVTRL